MATDAELDSAARAHALRHQVSYMEALKQVVAFAEPAATTPAFAEGGPGGLSDQELDRRAKAHAGAQGVGYWDALKQVVAFAEAAAPTPAFAEAAPGGLSDQELDRRAKAHAAAQGVSYWDALKQVSASPAPSFAEASAGGLVCFRESSQAVIAFAAAADLEGQWIDIFRAGRHIDDSGDERVFTESDIDDMARGYQPALREAPLVVGHPATNGPAFGWVAELRRGVGGVLQMRAKQVNERFAEAVREGSFKKRSAAFYPPSHPSNPNPGKWYLRHVGFLGATQPAIAGLADPVL